MPQKSAQANGSALPDPVVAAASAESVPSVQISNKPPAGQNGPKGIQPRQTYSRVNTGAPPIPDAGSAGQKSMEPRGLEFLPKLSEATMPSTQMTTTPTIQEMLKAAMAGTIDKIDVTTEAARQLGATTDKTASARASDSIPTEDLLKLADAIGFIADQLEKGAAIELPHPAGGAPAPGTGPGAIKVMKAESSGGPVLHPGGSGGKAEAGAPMETGKHGPAPSNAMGTNEKMHHGSQPVHPMGKNAEDASKLAASNLERLEKVALLPKPDMAMHAANLAKKTLPSLAGAGGMAAHFANKAAPAAAGGIVSQIAKQAEDAINPAQISGGAAVPPDASAAGEKNLPAPHGSTNLIESNRAAIDYTKRDAKSEPITEVGRVFTETPMKDPVLREVFDHAGQAGVKTSSARLDMTKVSAARALLSKLAAEVDEKAKAKSKESNMGGGAPPPPGVPSPAFTQ